MRASQQGHVAIVELLLHAHADVNAIIEGRDSAIMWAAARGHRDIVVALAKHGAEIQRLSNGKYSTIDRIHQLLEVRTYLFMR